MKTEKFSHKGSQYEVHFLLGREALSMAYRLGRYIGPSIGKLAGGQGGAEFADAVKSFFDNCSESDFNDFAQTIFKNLQIDNKPGEHHWQMHFHGKPGELFQVLVKAVKIQFADFFQELIDSNVMKTTTPESIKTTLID